MKVKIGLAIVGIQFVVGTFAVTQALAQTSNTGEIANKGSLCPKDESESRTIKDVNQGGQSKVADGCDPRVQSCEAQKPK